ncbi:pseudouridine synthase [Spongiibacter marinus]|uniref:pseudouridine synthase n=1 Tax=Spongiibacter marinus TaxID=354246 RepID=UPI003C53B810
MTANTTRLDRFIRQHTAYAMSDTRLLLAQGRIVVDGERAQSINQRVDRFSRVEVDGLCLQADTPLYIALNKPKGVVSATRDNAHRTVIDVLDHPRKAELHIVGRLDFNTTGLVLLSNDGSWSRRISLPETKLAKVYWVEVATPLSQDYIDAFQRGVYFAYEGITTQPAQLQILSATTARLTLTEGKYHQVKRMFGDFDNEVLALHRESVGPVALADLALGESRLLSKEELAAIARYTAPPT